MIIIIIVIIIIITIIIIILNIIVQTENRLLQFCLELSRIIFIYVRLILRPAVRQETLRQLPSPLISAHSNRMLTCEDSNLSLSAWENQLSTIFVW